MSPENNKESLSCRETELTLSLPGSNRGSVEPKLGSSEDRSGSFKVWLLVKTNSEKTIIAANRDRSKWKYVKVSFDGNPILRKINLEAHGSYRHLTAALEELVVAQSRRRRRQSSFTLTYQDKDGDWMLVGDVPWRMFVDSCKRLRLMDSSGFISSPNY